MSSPNIPDEESPVLHLTEDQCWTRLHGQHLGRIAMIRGRSVEILPLNYIAVGRSIFFATSSPTIMHAAESETTVAFEVDSHDGWTAWSVLVHGRPEVTADELPDGYEIRSMLPTPKHARIRLSPSTISGRLFDQALIARHAARPN